MSFLKLVNQLPHQFSIPFIGGLWSTPYDPPWASRFGISVWGSEQLILQGLREILENLHPKSYEVAAQTFNGALGQSTSIEWQIGDHYHCLDMEEAQDTVPLPLGTFLDIGLTLDPASFRQEWSLYSNWAQSQTLEEPDLDVVVYRMGFGGSGRMVNIVARLFAGWDRFVQYHQAIGIDDSILHRDHLETWRIFTGQWIATLQGLEPAAQWVKLLTQKILKKEMWVASELLEFDRQDHTCVGWWDGDILMVFVHRAQGLISILRGQGADFRFNAPLRGISEPDCFNHLWHEVWFSPASITLGALRLSEQQSYWLRQQIAIDKILAK